MDHPDDFAKKVSPVLLGLVGELPLMTSLREPECSPLLQVNELSQPAFIGPSTQL